MGMSGKGDGKLFVGIEGIGGKFGQAKVSQETGGHARGIVRAGFGNDRNAGIEGVAGGGTTVVSGSVEGDIDMAQALKMLGKTGARGENETSGADANVFGVSFEIFFGGVVNIV